MGLFEGLAIHRCGRARRRRFSHGDGVECLIDALLTLRIGHRDRADMTAVVRKQGDAGRTAQPDSTPPTASSTSVNSRRLMY